MNYLVFIVTCTFFLASNPLRIFQKYKNTNSFECFNNENVSSSMKKIKIYSLNKLKKIIDDLLEVQKTKPQITLFPKNPNEKEDWESGEIPWDFVGDRANISVALNPHSIAMLLL